MGETVLIVSTEGGTLLPNIEAIKHIKEKLHTKVAVFGVIDRSNSKFPFVNFLLRYLENPDEPSWLRQEDKQLSGFPCDFNKGIIMWNEAIFIDSENEGEKIAVMLMAARQRDDNDVGLEVAKQMFRICSTVIFIMNQDEDVS